MPPITQEMIDRRSEMARIGGRGTVRRHVKVVHKSAPGDDKKVQAVLKRLGTTPVEGIEEATFFKSDGTAMVFKAPKFQANQPSGCYVVQGNFQTQNLGEVPTKA